MLYKAVQGCTGLYRVAHVVQGGTGLYVVVAG